jgi:hypothetical protein
MYFTGILSLLKHLLNEYEKGSKLLLNEKLIN